MIMLVRNVAALLFWTASAYIIILSAYINVLKRMITKIDILLYLFYNLLFWISDFVLLYRRFLKHNYFHSKDKWKYIEAVSELLGIPLGFLNFSWMILIDSIPTTLFEIRCKRLLFFSIGIVWLLISFISTFWEEIFDLDISIFGTTLTSVGSIRRTAAWTMTLVSNGIFVKSICFPDSMSVFKSRVAYKRRDPSAVSLLTSQESLTPTISVAFNTPNLDVSCELVATLDEYIDE